jgi:hypothetical protein
MVYVLWMRPPMYDGFRHFLFIVPPLFVFAGLGAEALLRWSRFTWLRGLLVLLLLGPALFANIRLHPYQYTYYNLYAGSTHGAAYRYETDYWLTCYKDAMGWVNQNAQDGQRVFVNREGYIAAYYARGGVEVIDMSRQTTVQARAGDYMLQTSRADPGIRKVRTDPEAILIQRQGAIFCAIRPYP